MGKSCPFFLRLGPVKMKKERGSQGMSNSINKNAYSDELRMQNYRSQLEKRNDMALEDLRVRYSEDTRTLSEDHVDRMTQLKKAYDLKISEEAEYLEDQLNSIRASARTRSEEEKRAGEEEINRLKSAHTARVEEYRRNSEEQLDKMRKEAKLQTEHLHEQTRKTAKKEKELKV